MIGGWGHLGSGVGGLWFGIGVFLFVFVSFFSVWFVSAICFDFCLGFVLWVFLRTNSDSATFSLTDDTFVFLQLKWFLSRSHTLLPGFSLTIQQRGVTSYPSPVTGHLQIQ